MVCGGRSVRLLDRGTGNAEWTYTVGNPIERALNRQVVAASLGGAAFDDQHVAVNVTGGVNELVLLDANAGGKVVWQKKLAISPVWAPVIWQDRVVVTTVNSVDVFDVATGEQVIHLKTDRPRKRAEALDDGRLLVGGMTSLACIDLTSGRTLWSRPYRLYYNNAVSNDGVVQIGNRCCYVSYTTDRKVFCLDVEGGEELWSVTIGGAQDRPFALRLAGDDIYVLVMTTRGRDRSVRVHQLSVADGKQGWQSPALEPKEPDATFLATARDWRVGREQIVLLVDLWQMKQVGRAFTNTVREPMLYALDRQTGKVVQEIEIPGETKPPAVIRPTNLLAADDMLWVTYWDHMIGLRGAKQP
ncbi:MAG TPA: PQQ-binding-like beta-propeller repeat protein, partial [Planctomycetota bacterium]|nr:PQQ-binding-like beta-propeller repeat protein [Planctomycetota bacterium]